MIDEYVSNPRLALLAEELRILNEGMITQNLHSAVRLHRLRQFAAASNDITSYADTSHLYDDEALPRGITMTNYGKFRARFSTNDGRQSASFDTVQEAITALEEARA